MNKGIKDTLYLALISAVITVLITHYEKQTGQSIVELLKDKLPR